MVVPEPLRTAMRYTLVAQRFAPAPAKFTVRGVGPERGLAVRIVHTGATETGGVVVTLDIQDAGDMFPFTVQRGANVPAEEYVQVPFAELMICPFPQSIETVVALVVLQVTTDERGYVPVVGETEIALQAGVADTGHCVARLALHEATLLA